MKENDLRRGIASVFETSDLTAIIAIRPTTSALFAAPVDVPPTDKDVLKEHRYSIHPSDKSETGISAIKSTIRFADDREIFQWQMTTALKTKYGFAPIFVRRCPRLENPSSDIKKDNSSDIYLGSYDPLLFTLIMGLFVGHRDRIFVWRTTDDFQIKQFITQRFRIVILWTFLPVPALNQGLVISYGTDQHVHAPIFSEDECVLQFREQRQKSITDLIHAYQPTKHLPAVALALSILSHPFFVRTANMHSEEFIMGAQKSGNPNFR